MALHFRHGRFVARLDEANILKRINETSVMFSLSDTICVDLSLEAHSDVEIYWKE